MNATSHPTASRPSPFRRPASRSSPSESAPASGRNGWGEPACSADTIGRVHSLLDANGLRQGIHHVYDCLKRNKALPDIQGMALAVLDGHESHASYLRHCSGCLQRTIHSEPGDRVQFYHRHVTLMLLPGATPGREPVRLLLDHEPQRAGEDDSTSAERIR